MFTGIIEEVAEIVDIKNERTNLLISLKANFTNDLSVDQSVSHNGVCLTVVDIENDIYSVVAVKETLEKTNLNNLHIGSKVNLERSLKLGSRIDGHIVQGHVDQIAECIDIKSQKGSWVFTFKHNYLKGNTTVEKGSISVNGVSLTVINSSKELFSVAIIPYTFENTNFKYLQIGDVVNLEFDIIGKYIAKMTLLNN